jgi:hypothetical protein
LAERRTSIMADLEKLRVDSYISNKKTLDETISKMEILLDSVLCTGSCCDNACKISETISLLCKTSNELEY